MFKYSLPLKGKNKLLIYEKSFTLNAAGTIYVYQNGLFDYTQVEKHTYISIGKLLNEMYERGYYDAQKNIRKKLKEFRHSMGDKNV